jgi:serine/threonine-protein kinase
MTKADRWRHCQEILAASWDLAPEDQDRFLAERAGSDSELLAELRGFASSLRRSEAWQPPPEAVTESLLRSRVGPYEIDRLLGRGGMGAVYLAHRADGQFDQVAAIKVIGLPFDLDAFRERFRRERQILAKLSHPSIARLLDGGTTGDGELYLVMEYIDGTSITRFASDRKLSTAERLCLFRDACAGVEFAHQNLIVHRDIKPSNILVDTAGVPKLLDFGTAKVLEEHDATLTGPAAMTMAYASPEQLRGDAVSTLSDVFSLGVVLFELLTGKKMFGENLASRFASQQTWDKTSLDSDLQRIIAKATAVEPAERYSSARELSEDVRRYLNREPVLAHPARWSYRSRKFVRRHPWNVALASAFVLGMTGAVVYSTRQANLARRQAVRAQHFSNFLGDLLSSPNPSWYNTLKSRGKNVTVVEVLGELRGRLGKELGSEPDVEIDLHRSIGRMYTAVGDHESARAELSAALQKQLALKDARPEDTAKIYVARAAENYYTANFAQTLADARAALGALGPPGRREVRDVAEVRMEAWNAAGVASSELGVKSDAEIALIEALRLSRELSGTGGGTPASLGALATFYYRYGRLEESARLSQEALSLYRPGSAESANRIRDLGLICIERRDYACAGDHLQRALNIAEASFGPASLFSLHIHFAHGHILGVTGKHAEGLREIQSAREGAIRLGGLDSLLVAEADVRLGRMEMESGNFAGAEGPLRRAQAIFQKNLPKDDPRLLNIVSRMGECLIGLGKRDEGARLLQESHLELEATLGKDNFWTQEAKQRLEKIGR